MSDNPPIPHMSGAYWRIGSIITTFDPIPAPSAGIFDAPTVYVCCNSEWWSLILERVRVLTRLDAWQGDADEKFRATQEIERFLAAVNCEDCSDFVTDIRVGNNGKIQKKVGGAWVDANGDGGDTTVVNNFENQVKEAYPPLPEETGIPASERACSIAENMVDWWLEKFNDTLDAIDATGDLIAAADVALALFPPLYIAVQPFTEAINQAIEATTSVLRALLTSGLRDDMICAIYCIIKDVGYINEGTWSTVEEEIELLMSEIGNLPLLPTLSGMIKYGISDGGNIHRASLYQTSGSSMNCDLLCIDCAEGGCSLYSEDETAWAIIQGTHANGLCDGTEGVVASGGAAEVVLTLPSLQSISSISLKDNNSTGSPMNMLVEIYEDTTLVATVFDQTFSDVHNCNFSAWSPNEIGNKVRIRFSSGAGISISSITVCWNA